MLKIERLSLITLESEKTKELRGRRLSRLTGLRCRMWLERKLQWQTEKRSLPW